MTTPILPPSPAESFAADLSEGAEAGVYLALLELIEEGLLIITDELIIDANSAACGLLAREYRELAGQPLRKLFCSEADFIASRGRLLVQGQRRSTETLCLPDGSSTRFKLLCAPRLRPGIHALVLSPADAAQPSPATAAAAPTRLPAATAFAPHLDPEAALASRPASFFDGRQWPSANARQLAGQLWQALEEDQLSLAFQPLVDSRRKRWQAGEALLRWQHPQHGLLTYSDFRHALHDPHLIACVGDRVLAQACAIAAHWDRQLQLAVNVAAEQLLLDGFVDNLAELLARHQLHPSRLELDIDESLLETDNSALASTTAELAELGVRLAIDDFGRGLSSIPRLRRHPIRSLKLDPRLVAGVGHCEDSEASVEAIATMGSSLGLSIVARGVSTAPQRDFLSALGCRLQQGPLYGQPLSASAFSARQTAG